MLRQRLPSSQIGSLHVGHSVSLCVMIPQDTTALRLDLPCNRSSIGLTTATISLADSMSASANVLKGRPLESISHQIVLLPLRLRLNAALRYPTLFILSRT